LSQARVAIGFPVVLAPRADGTKRLCFDYRKVNSVTKTDSFPIPRLGDCIDEVGKARYVTTIDMLKGFWQVPLTERSKEILAFVALLNGFDIRRF